MWFAAVKILFAPFITYLYATLIAEGHILERLGMWLNEEREGKLIWYRKPLGACLICCNIWVSLLCLITPSEVVTIVGIIGISNYLIQKI